MAWTNPLRSPTTQSLKETLENIRMTNEKNLDR